MDIRSATRFAAGRIAGGFFFGVGAFVAIVALYATIFPIAAAQVEQRMKAAKHAADEADRVALADLVISELTEHRSDDRYTLTGRVTNKSDRAAHSISLRADLFDAATFVAQCTDTVAGEVAAGDSAYFQISCGCNQKPPPAHDAFKVAVTSVWP